MPPNLKRIPSGYLFRKVVPKHLRGILGKSEIKVRCGKSYTEALANYHIESVKAQQLIDGAQAKLLKADAEISAARHRRWSPQTSLQPITQVTPEIVDHLRSFWLSGLEHDLQERAQGLSDEQFSDEAENIAEMRSLLSQASARGQIEFALPSMHQLLHLRGYVLAVSPEEERRLAYLYLDTLIEGYEILHARHAGQRLRRPDIGSLLPEFRPHGVAPTNKEDNRLKLGTVVETFLQNYAKKKSGQAMLKKHQVALTLFSEVLGPKLPVEQIRQVQINEYFEKIQRLPARWPDICRRHKISVSHLLNNEKLLGTQGMAPKTFNDSYRASVSSFLRAAKRDFQDQGFPTTLTTEGIEYSGTRIEGEHAQRAMRPDELKRLFEGAEMETIAQDPSLAHQYWLPHLGLFSGARINELCQVNPQADIHVDQASGALYLRITDDTPSDENVKKTTKNKISKRNVPIHPKLIELGFQAYVVALQKAGAKLLFPGFSPKSGRASPEAERWFRQFIAELGLRDETPGARLVGFHAFRSTILAAGQELEIDLTTITGHAGTLIADFSGMSGGVRKSADPVLRKYQGEMSLSLKLKRLNRLEYPVTFFKPVPPIHSTSS